MLMLPFEEQSSNERRDSCLAIIWLRFLRGMQGTLLGLEFSGLSSEAIAILGREDRIFFTELGDIGTDGPA